MNAVFRPALPVRPQTNVLTRSTEQVAQFLGYATPQTADQLSDLIDCLSVEKVAVKLDGGMMTLSRKDMYGAPQRIKNLFSTCKAVVRGAV